jgi:predicted MFS family arabinose efflux permease
MARLEGGTRLLAQSRYLVLGLMFAGCVYVTEIPLVNLILPEIAGDLGVGSTHLEMIANAYGISVAVAVIASGWLGDRFGLRSVILSGIGLFGLGALICSLSWEFDVLIAGRVIQGIGGGLFSPLIPVALARLAPDRPGRSLAIWNTVIGLVIASVPLLSVPILETHGWRAVMGVLGLVALAACSTLSVNHRRIAGPAPTLERDQNLSGDVRFLPFLLIYVALNYGTMLLFLFWAPIQMDRPDLPSMLTGTLLSLSWFFFGAIGFLIRRSIDTTRVLHYILLSPLVLCAGWMVFLWSGDSLVRMIAAGCMVGAGLGLGNAPSTLLILRHAPPGRSSLAISLDVTFARLGAVLIIALLGSVTDRLNMALGLGVICLLNLLVALPLVRPYVPRPRVR